MNPFEAFSQLNHILVSFASLEMETRELKKELDEFCEIKLDETTDLRSHILLLRGVIGRFSRLERRLSRLAGMK